MIDKVENYKNFGEKQANTGHYLGLWIYTTYIHMCSHIEIIYKHSNLGMFLRTKNYSKIFRNIKKTNKREVITAADLTRRQCHSV